MKKNKLICVCLLLSVMVTSIFAAEPVEKSKDMGRIPEGTELYVAALNLAYTTDKTEPKKAGESSFQIESLNIANNEAVVLATIAESISIFRIRATVQSIGGNLVVSGKTVEKCMNSKWEPVAENSITMVRINKKSVPYINIHQEVIGTKFMEVLKSDQYAEIKKKVDADSRTWSYISAECANEQELAEFFNKNNLLGNPVTWQYVLAKCSNDIKFERFLNNYQILSTNQMINCTLLSLEMFDEFTSGENNGLNKMPSQAYDKKYATTFKSPVGKVYIFSDDATYIDNNIGDAITLDTKITSYEYSTKNPKNGINLIIVE